MLQDVSRVDGFDKLWSLLRSTPCKIPGLTDISDIFNTKTNSGMSKETYYRGTRDLL
jgi:hypothetical protein